MKEMDKLTVETVYKWLETVKDPEIPVLSLMDMGIITGVEISGRNVKIEMTPTFVGCPALEMMKEDITQTLTEKGAESIEIAVTFKNPWTSDRISEKGRLALKKFGLAPPPSRQIFEDLEVLEHAICPRCNGTNTEIKNPFGATLCRSIHYCKDCQEAFEQFKPI